MTYRYHGLSVLADDMAELFGSVGYHFLLALAIGGAFMLFCCFTPRVVRGWWMAGWAKVFGRRDDD